MKHDGTRAYYFPKEEVSALFKTAGFEEIENNVHYRYLENRKTGLQMYRVWLQGRFFKPLTIKEEVIEDLSGVQNEEKIEENLKISDSYEKNLENEE